MNIKKNDTVVVLSGKDKGKKGKVLEAMPATGKVIVEGINIATCHVKPKKQGEEGGIIRREIPMYASKVMRVCPKCGKATREAFKVENGAKVRVCKKCGPRQGRVKGRGSRKQVSVQHPRLRRDRPCRALL